MGAHTPGPWTARDLGNEAEWEVVKLDPAKAALSPDPWFVCTVFDDADGGTAEDNARLISAAPELLEAGREMVRWFQFWSGKTTNQEAAVEAMLSAIAKAEGRTNAR